MKYVIFQMKQPKLGIRRLYWILFPDWCTHSIMGSVAATGINFEHKEMGSAEIISAGFCYMRNDQWKCVHGSESLNIPKDAEVDEADAAILNMPDFYQGIIPDDDAVDDEEEKTA